MNSRSVVARERFENARRGCLRHSRRQKKSGSLENTNDKATTTPSFAQKRVHAGRRGARTMGRKRCSHGKEKSHRGECNPCPHGKVKKSCVKCKGCPHGKLKRNCAACKSTRAERSVSPQIKQELEIKLEPDIKQEPFTIQGYFGFGQ